MNNSDLSPAVGAVPLKKSVADFWNAAPCGTRNIQLDRNTPAFYERLERERDRLEPFIATFAQFPKRRGQDVLEVGIGAATDFIRFARAGARLHGIDLTRSGVELAKIRLALEGLQATVLQSDAETLPFAENLFDFVYSWGVIHHSENPAAAAREIIRVAKPGGEVCVMIYHRYSLFTLQAWILNGLLKGKPHKTFAEILWNHVESIGTKAYSISEAAKMFEGLDNLIITPVVTPYDARLSRTAILPQWMRKLIPAKLGWFLVVRGRKAK